MSSFGIQPETKRIDVDEGFLPCPATKLVISQYLKACSGRPAHWAWIIVGAFYDKDDVCLWSTEVFAAHLDIDPDYEPFQWANSDSEAESESESETGTVAEEVVDAGTRRQEQTSARSQAQPSSSVQPSSQPPALTHGFSQRLPSHPVPFHPQPYVYLPPPFHFHPPPARGYWSPSLYTAPPGNWVSAFDPDTGNWVNTWQPRQ